LPVSELRVVVEWDEAERRPRIVFEPAYDGSEGTEVRYESEARHQPAYGLKYWRIGADRPGDAGYRRRLNVYYPDHVEKYVSDQRDKGGDWQPYDEEQGIAVAGDDIQWPEWVGKDGSPLGIPVVHFRNRDQGWNYGQSELKSVVPLQNALNKALIDLLAAADTSAFQILYMLGDDPSDIELTPGAFVYSSKPDVKVGAIPGASLGQLVDLKDAVAMDIARVSRTPLSFFQISRQRAAEGTLKQEEAGLVARAQRAQVGYGNAWEDAMRLCIRLSNAYGGTSFPEDVQISTQWAEAETRNETAHMEELRAKRELGVPIERLWAEAGYSPDEIEDMKASEEYQARVAMLRMGTELGGEAENG